MSGTQAHGLHSVGLGSTPCSATYSAVIMFRLLPSVLLLLLLAGCTGTRQYTRNIDDAELLRSVVMARVPPGTPLSEAQRLMELEGFDCEVDRNVVFVERRQFNDEQPRKEGVDILSCRRTESAGLLMTRLIDIGLVLNGETVTGVLVSDYVDGP